MRRSLSSRWLALVALASLGLVARGAVADDFKWDPKHKAAPPKVGDKSSEEITDFKKNSLKVSSGGQTLQSVKEETTVTYRLAKEVLAVEGKHATETLVKVEKWKLEKKGEDADTTLEGHTIRVKGKGEARTATIEDDKDSKVSDEAKQWVESELGAKKKKPAKKSDDEDDDDMKNFFPKEPVGDGAEWKPDLEALAKELGMDYVPEKSSGTGKLTKVHVENGAHMGHVAIKVSLQTKTPKVTWTEGGVMEIAIDVDTCLDSDRPEQTDGGFEIKFGGKGDAAGPQGVVNLKQSLDQKRTAKIVPVVK